MWFMICFDDGLDRLGSRQDHENLRAWRFEATYMHRNFYIIPISQNSVYTKNELF